MIISILENFTITYYAEINEIINKKTDSMPEIIKNQMFEKQKRYEQKIDFLKKLYPNEVLLKGWSKIPYEEVYNNIKSGVDLPYRRENLYINSKKLTSENIELQAINSDPKKSKQENINDAFQDSLKEQYHTYEIEREMLFKIISKDISKLDINEEAAGIFNSLAVILDEIFCNTETNQTNESSIITIRNIFETVMAKNPMLDIFTKHSVQDNVYFLCSLADEIFKQEMACNLQHSFHKT